MVLTLLKLRQDLFNGSVGNSLNQESLKSLFKLIDASGLSGKDSYKMVALINVNSESQLDRLIDQLRWENVDLQLLQMAQSVLQPADALYFKVNEVYSNKTGILQYKVVEDLNTTVNNSTQKMDHRKFKSVQNAHISISEIIGVSQESALDVLNEDILRSKEEQK